MAIKDENNVGISKAILSGMAVAPSEFPTSCFSALSSTGSLVELAFEALAPYFAGDPLFAVLPDVCYETFDFPLSMAHTLPNCTILELFGGLGATASDFGARFTARIMTRLQPKEPLVARARTKAEENSFIEAFKGTSLDVEINAQEDGLKGIPVDGRNIAFILGQSVAFIYAAMHDAIEMDNRYHSKEIYLSNFIVPQSNPELLNAVFFARAIGAPIGKVVVAEVGNPLISDYLRNGGKAPGSLGMLLQIFTEKELREFLQAFVVTETQVEQAQTETARKTSYPISRNTAACEAVRSAFFPVHQFILVAAEAPQA